MISKNHRKHTFLILNVLCLDSSQEGSQDSLRQRSCSEGLVGNGWGGGSISVDMGGWPGDKSRPSESWSTSPGGQVRMGRTRGYMDSMTDEGSVSQAKGSDFLWE